MHEKLIREINGEIADALLARKLPFAPSRKAALALLKVPGWTEGLEQMLPIRGRLECAHVLELCSCVLPRLAPRPEEGWLAFCTQYARERMYPGQGFAPDREEYEAGALFFLTVLQVMLDRERRAVPFDPLKDFQFLSSEEMGEYECGEEYRRFLAAFREEYVYEMMRLSEETTPFRTLGHIAGVHYIAMTVARGIREVITLWGCTQEEAAKRLGIAQPTLNNKLRLLALNEEQQAYCIANGLTERHARAVLRLPESEQRSRALAQFVKKRMNARQADEYVEQCLQQKKPPRRRPVPMVRDVRIFVNTINKAVRLMVDAGVPAHTTKREGEGFVEYTVHIPTEPAKKTATSGAGCSA